MAAKFSFFLGLIICSVSITANAQDLTLQGFDQEVFNYHFNRADREMDPASWMREARRGLELALGGWERTALEFYEDPALRLEARRELLLWTEEELEKRYGEWLFRRFFGVQAGDMAKALDLAVDRANRIYAYHTGGDGTVLYGETGDPETVRPAEGRSVEDDRMAWNFLVSDTATDQLDAYEAALASSFPELLFYVDEEDRPRFENRIKEISLQSLLSRREEFEALLAREERLFIARRTGDIWSLRKQSENQSAFAISSQLIKDAEIVCASGIESLEERIEAARAGTGDLSLAGTEWLALFQEQFDRGLKAWADAEERFIIRRMEWERDSGDLFSQGEETWKAAFSELEKERLAWEDKSRELFNAGEMLFLKASEELQTAIGEARAEFQKDAALRAYSGAQRASALAEMYITCGTVLAEARESVQFWLPRFVGDPPADALETDELARWVRLKMSSGGPLSEGQKTAGQELIRWSGIFTQYSAKALESLTVLEKEFGLVLGMDRGALNSILAADSEDFFLDEYQVELLRAKAVAGYWEQRHAIARAVSAYAEELSAGRITEAEGLRQWTGSKARYDKALADYEEIQNQLKDKGSLLASVQRELQNAAEALAEAERELDDLSSRYALQMAAYRVDSGNFILAELGSYYGALVEAVEKRRGDDAYYTAYLRAEQKYIEESLLQDGWLLLRNIVETGGDEEAEEAEEAGDLGGDDDLRQMRLSLLGAGSGTDWYFAVTGKEDSPEERQALENEGLFNRLIRDAGKEAVPGRASMVLSVYRELSAYAPGLQGDAAEAARGIMQRVFSEFGYEGSGGNLPDMAVLTDSLFLYGENHRLDPGHVTASLLESLDRRMEMLPPALEGEFTEWKNSLIQYMAVKTLYLEIEVSGDTAGMMERYGELAARIMEAAERGEAPEDLVREAVFYQYLVAFFAAHGDAAAGEEGPEHWRLYISSPRFDPHSINNSVTVLPGETGRPEEAAAGPVKGALSRKEALLADARDAAETAERKFSEALELFLESGLSGRQREFIAAADFYLKNPGAVWEYSSGDFEYSIALEIFKEELDKLQNSEAFESSLKQEIARLGFEYGALPPSGQEALEHLQVISAELDQARILHQKALEQYSRQAALYEAEGSRYENLYGEAKDCFSVLEKRRMEYETQDAIQRWAGTAYLSRTGELAEDVLYYKEPAEELAYAKERNDRAQAALGALRDLYAADKERPYGDGEYTALYKEYKDSFARMFLTLKAKTEFAAELEQEQIKNRELYLSVSALASGFANPLLRDSYESYAAPAMADSSWLNFVRITESGGLGISLDGSSFVLSPVDDSGAEDLSDYFDNKSFIGDGTSQMSAYEEALTAWSARMAGYNLSNMYIYQTWGLALDYLIRRIIESNPSVSSIGSSYELTDMGSDGDIKLDGDRLNKLLGKYRSNSLPWAQQSAWNGLNAQQKEDLEFLAILLLTGAGGDGAGGLTRVSEYKEMEWLFNQADYYKTSKKLLFVRITVYRWPYTFDHSVLDQILRMTKNRRNAFYDNVNYNRAVFSSGVSKLFAEKNDYEKSCDKLAVFSKQREEGIAWDDIEAALVLFENIEEAEIKTLEKHWEEMHAYRRTLGDETPYFSVGSALDGLYAWGRGIKDALELRFENAYLEDEELRRENQAAYRKTLDAFINGDASMDELNDTAQLAYGPAAPALTNHLKNLGTAMLSDLKTINADRAVYTRQYRELALQYTDLVGRAYRERFNAELAVRETDWQEQQKDLNNKLAAWREAAGLILERGRKDWKEGFEEMQSAFARWQQDFKDRYTGIDTAWNAAYLESRTDKENWINHAVQAADEALNDSLLALIGSDAESYGRKLDGFIPSAIPGFGAQEEAAAILQRALNSAGVASLSGALTSVAGSAATVLTRTQTGVSGIGVWDSGRVHETAKAIAWESTRELASGKMVLLAFQARESANDAKRLLDETIAKNNSDFNGSMDELYTMNGGWTRWGNMYNKDIIVNSTVFTSAVTDRVNLEAYRWFVLDYWDFAVDLSDNNLEGLDYLGVQALIALAQDEVHEKSKAVFGGEDTEGDFNIWIGKNPVMVNGTITNPGSGELGRLMSEFYKWEIKQGEGIAAMNAPLWDKPLWDSRGSWFGAPNIRVVADIANSIASAVLVAVSPFTAGATLALAVGVNMLDETLFYALDAAQGYKSWDEAGFAFGQKAIITTATTIAGAAFSGVGSATSSGFAGITAKAVQSTSGFGTVAVKTAMSGIQAIGTSTVTSALSAVTYNNGKFGWSQDVFTAGIKGGLAGSAVAGLSTFTSSAMNLGLEGFFDRYYADGTKLSSLTGGLAGQGLNYALGGDFTLNAFDLGLIHKSAAGTGLVELRFGEDGFNAGFGLGGVDISLGTMAGAIRGLEAWKVNFDIWNSDSEDAKKYASQLRTLYSGSAATKDAYNSILAGTTRIMEDRNESFTESVYNPITGVKTILLGENALNDDSRFGLNVVFSHEAYRNGIYDGAERQQMEGDMAVMGHIGTALGLMQSYGGGVIGKEMAGEALDFVENYYTLVSADTGNQEKLDALTKLVGIFDSYDSSADYWKIKMYFDGSHEIVMDFDAQGNPIKRLSIDYYNASKKELERMTPEEQKKAVISTMTPAGQKAENEMTLEESLGKIIGLDRASKILGSNLENPDVYNTYILRTVFGETTAAAIQRSGYFNESIDDAKIQTLIGKRLLDESKAFQIAGKWKDLENVSLTLTDRKLLGNIFAELNGNGYFDYSQLNAYVMRNTNSYLSEMDAGSRDPNQGLDFIDYRKTTLAGTMLDQIIIDRYQTVDNTVKGGTNSPWKHPVYGTIQGNTIAPGTFNMEYLGTSASFKNSVLVINNALTLSGIKINNRGRDPSLSAWSARWLGHDNKTEGTINVLSDGCFVTTIPNQLRLLQWLKNQGLQSGYQIKTRLYEYTPSPRSEE